MRVSAATLLLAVAVTAAPPHVGGLAVPVEPDDVVWRVPPGADDPVRCVVKLRRDYQRTPSRVVLTWEDEYGGTSWTSVGPGTVVYPSREAALRVMAGRVRDRADALRREADRLDEKAKGDK